MERKQAQKARPMSHSAVKILETAQDVTEPILRVAESVSDSWFSDEDSPIDWEEFIDKFADPHNHHEADAFDIENYDNPAVNKIKRHVRAYRKAT